MTRDELEFLKNLATSNPEYANALSSVIDSEIEKRKYIKDETLNCAYEFEVPFIINLDSILEIYNNHKGDEDFDSFAEGIVGSLATLVMEYADSNKSSGEYDQVLATLMGDSIRASMILGLGGKKTYDIDLGELFRHRRVPGHEVTKILIGGLRMSR